MTNSVHIVDTTHANVGAMFVILSSVGELTSVVGCDARELGAEELAKRAGATTDRRLMAHFSEVDGGFGLDG
jgi:serine acetyltransferase